MIISMWFVRFWIVLSVASVISCAGATIIVTMPGSQTNMVNSWYNPCSPIICANGGYCDTLHSATPRCICKDGFSGPSCQSRDRVIGTQTPCDNFRCENRGLCLVDNQNIPSCVCTTGYSGPRCENKEYIPIQSITNLRCDSACSTATSCRICLPCNTCQYQTMCLAYEVLVKSLDADCHAQGYMESLLMKSTASPLGYAAIKCRGQGPTRDCPQGSTCVDDGYGGGTCCRNMVGRDRIENKDGFCPVSSVDQNCGRLFCLRDSDCAGNLKCCRECGNRCTNPYSFPPIDRQTSSCLFVTCANGGRCVSSSNAAYCECPMGFFGSRCEVRGGDLCRDWVCLNGGRCVMRGSEPSCECPRDYMGPKCGIRVQPCTNFICLNGGTCVTSGDTPICQCPQGATGPRCGIVDDPCQSFACQHGGRCTLRGNVPFCECLAGFSGVSCQNRDDPCSNFACLNGGNCVTNGGNPICQCPRGYTGPRCGQVNDPCSNIRCLNGGNCVANGGNPICQCPRGYSGPRCGLVEDPCMSVRCMNGGVCRSQGNTAFCSCLSGYSGSRCEIVDRIQTWPPILCPLFGCNKVTDQCGGCPSGSTCQFIAPACSLCGGNGSYRCVTRSKKR